MNILSSTWYIPCFLVWTEEPQSFGPYFERFLGSVWDCRHLQDKMRKASLPKNQKSSWGYCKGRIYCQPQRSESLFLPNFFVQCQSQVDALARGPLRNWFELGGLDWVHFVPEWRHPVVNRDWFKTIHIWWFWWFLGTVTWTIGVKVHGAKQTARRDTIDTRPKVTESEG